MSFELEDYRHSVSGENSEESVSRFPTPLPQESEADAPTPVALSTSEIMAMLEEGDEMYVLRSKWDIDVHVSFAVERLNWLLLK